MESTPQLEAEYCCSSRGEEEIPEEGDIPFPGRVKHWTCMARVEEDTVAWVAAEEEVAGHSDPEQHPFASSCGEEEEEFRYQ